MNSNILPTLGLLVAVGIFFLYINPTWSGPVAVTQAAIKSDDDALLAAKQYVAQEHELADKRDAINQGDLARLAIFLPESVDNVRLILDLNALAAHSGVALSGIDVATAAANSASAAAAGPVGSVDISLSVTGTYGAFKTFLMGVEKSERLLDVTDLTIKGSDTGVYDYHLSIRLYWLR